MKKALLIALLAVISGCNTVSKAINPFYESPPPEAYLGNKNDHALNGEKQKEEKAREALTEMGTFRPANAPAPYNPVLQPAVVRLMWVPDRLNRNGDLIPAHYYYLRVLQDRWALQDAFEINKQLSGDTPKTSGIPFTYQD
jgi:hypothetical protein